MPRETRPVRAVLREKFYVELTATLSELSKVDAAFAKLTRAEIENSISRRDIKPMGIAARLTNSCGALGGAKLRSESAENARKRMKHTFERARASVP